MGDKNTGRAKQGTERAIGKRVTAGVMGALTLGLSGTLVWGALASGTGPVLAKAPMAAVAKPEITAARPEGEAGTIVLAKGLGLALGREALEEEQEAGAEQAPELVPVAAGQSGPAVERTQGQEAVEEPAAHKEEAAPQQVTDVYALAPEGYIWTGEYTINGIPVYTTPYDPEATAERGYYFWAGVEPFAEDGPPTWSEEGMAYYEERHAEWEERIALEEELEQQRAELLGRDPVERVLDNDDIGGL